MPNALSEALDHLTTTLKGEAGESVTYRRGANTVTITAIPARTQTPIDDGVSVGVAILSEDFIVVPDELVLAGNRTLPQPGDEIDRTVDGAVTHTYVVRPESGMDCYSIDPLRRTLRIHTKRKS